MKIHIEKDPTLRTLFLQEALKARGFYSGPLDNWEGPSTRSALAAAAGAVMKDIQGEEAPPSEFDQRTNRNLSTLDRKARPAFERLARIGKQVASKYGCDYVMIAGHRTWAEQDALYAQGRTTAGRIVTKAKGGQSNHNFGIAADFGVFQSARYLDESNPTLAAKIHLEVAREAIAAGLNIEWGGDWKSMPDTPHFEIKTGLTMAEKRDLYSRLGSVLP